MYGQQGAYLPQQQQQQQQQQQVQQPQQQLSQLQIQQQQQPDYVQWTYVFHPSSSCDWNELDAKAAKASFLPTIVSKKTLMTQYSPRIQAYLQKKAAAAAKASATAQPAQPEGVNTNANASATAKAESMRGLGTVIQMGYGRLERIDMGSMQLYQVPQGLGNYRHQIKELYLSWNQLEEISSEIFTLHNLLALHLEHNLIREIPAGITRLKKLTDFNISHNRLRVLPFDIGRMPKLIKFLADGNPFDDAFMNSHLEIKQYLATGEARGLVRYFVNHMPVPEINVALLEREFRPVGKPEAQGEPAGTYVRVMTYNVLCPTMATTDMYMTTPDAVLDWNYRKERILHEIEMYNPDIICLQEVQAKAFETWFVPELRKLGYEGFAIMKSRGRWYHCADTIDGCATFYRPSSVSVVKRHEIEYSDDAKRLIRSNEFPQSSNTVVVPTPTTTPTAAAAASPFNGGAALSPEPSTSTISASMSISSLSSYQPAIGSVHPTISSSEDKDTPTGVSATTSAASLSASAVGENHDSSFVRLSRKDNVALVYLFEANGTRFFVSNTHIHWDPENSDLKIMQVQFLVEHLMKYAEEDFADQGGIDAAPFIVAGDYNSTPESGVYQLMSTGVVPSSHPDWRGADFGRYTSEGIHNSLHFDNAYAPLNIKYTNHTINYTGVLDYIWYTPASLKVLSLLDVPPLSVFENDLKLSLPNVYFPSDHLALLADFQVLKKKN